MGVGLRLKEILRDRKITIKQLAEMSDVSINTLYSITKRDSESIDSVILHRIAKALEVPITAIAKEAILEIPLPEYPYRVITSEEYERMSPPEREYAELRTEADIMPERLNSHLSTAFEQLNKLGKVEAVIRVRELTHLSKYTVSDPNDKAHIKLSFTPAEPAADSPENEIAPDATSIQD